MTPTMTLEEFLEGMRQATLADGDAGARKFVAENFPKLPEDAQGDVLIEFLIDAGKQREFENLALDVREAAIDALEEIDEAEAKLKVLDVQDDQAAS